MYCCRDTERTANYKKAKLFIIDPNNVMSGICPILCRQHSLVDCGRASHLPNARLVSQALIRRGEFDVSPEASIMVMIYGQGGSFSSGFVSSLRYLYIKGAPRWFFSYGHFSFSGNRLLLHFLYYKNSGKFKWAIYCKMGQQTNFRERKVAVIKSQSWHVLQ